MTVDLIKNKKTDKELVELSLVPYMMLMTLKLLNKAQPGTISSGWLEILDMSSAVPFASINKKRVPKLVKEVEDVTRKVFREVKAIDTIKEMSLSLGMLNLDLVRDNKFLDHKNQGVLFSAMLVQEAMDYEDIGNIKACRSASGSIRNCLNRLGYFI